MRLSLPYKTAQIVSENTDVCVEKDLKQNIDFV